MRLDVVTIFPEYLAPLRLSLIGRAVEDGLIDLQRPRPARLDHRPAPHRRRLAVRRRAGHADAPRAVGRGARRRLPDRAGPTGPPRIVVPTPGGAPFTQALAARARRRAVAGLRLRPVRGHRRPGARRGGATRPGRRGLARATTCSTAARWPSSSSSRPSPGCCPVSSATPSRWSDESHARAACWRRRSTPSRPSGAAATSRTSCSPATTRGSPAGAATSRCGVRRPAGPTWSSGWTPRRWTSRTSRCSPTWAGPPARTGDWPGPRGPVAD